MMCRPADVDLLSSEFDGAVDSWSAAVKVKGFSIMLPISRRTAWEVEGIFHSKGF